jgi:hypothetical protein
MTQHITHFLGRLVLRSVFALITVLLLIGLPRPLHGQVDTGSLTGTVTDSTGAKIVGALITLRNTDSGVVVKVPTTTTGTYFFGGLKAGTYSLEATQNGFKTYKTVGIQIHVQQKENIDIQLQVGVNSESVTVTTTDAALIQTEDATLGQTVDKETVDEMPLNGRNWASLGQIAAGVTTATTSVGGNAGMASAAWYVVNGVNFWQNDFRLNGINNNVEVYGGSQGNTNASITPPPDAIQEFKLQTGDFSAEFGHSAGGVINAVIKSGGNRVRGDLWEYVRNNDFDANDYFNKQNGLPRSPYHQNQFGGTVGGPVFIPKLYDGRNKTFFFFDYQGTRIVQPNGSTSTVPTALKTSSGFTNLEDLITYSNGATTPPQTDALGRIFPLGTVFDPATTRTVAANSVEPISGLQNTSSSGVSVRDPFYTGGSVGGITDFTTMASRLNQLPANRLDQNAIKILGLFPAPKTAGISNNYYQNAGGTSTTNQYDIRIDQNFGTKDVLFGVFDRQNLEFTVPNSLPGIANGQGFGFGTNPTPDYAVAVGYSHTFTPTLVNELHFGFNHDVANVIPNEGNTMGIPAQFGIKGIPQVPGNGGLPMINIGGLSGLGVAGWVPTIQTIYSTELSDNVTKVYGSHAFKVGYQLDILQGDIIQPAYAKGSFNYSGQFTSIPDIGYNTTGIADALLIPAPSSVGGVTNVGGLSSYGGSNYAAVNDRRYYMGTYFQDDWKVTPLLTLNLGIRWDRTTPYAEVDGKQANFIGSNGGNGLGGIYYIPNNTCKTPMSTSFSTLLAKDGISVKCISGLTTGNAQYSNFAPRVGFAYRFLPRAVIRGGYGIAYGALGNIGFGGTLGTNYPFNFNIGGSAPNSTTPLLLSNGATATMENTFAVIDLQDPISVNPANGIGLYGRQFNFQTPYTQTMNLAVQFQLGQTDAIQVGYVGTLGRHLDVQGTTNSPSAIVAPGANLYSYIPNPDFGPSSSYETTNGASAYNALQVIYTRQLSHGLSVLANYTFSKCFSDQAVINVGHGLRAQWLPGFGIKGDYALCDTDATQVVHVSGTYQMPVGRGRQFLARANKATDLVLGGWAFNYIITDQGGQPFTIGCPVSTTAFFGCNANVVAGQNLYAGAHNQKQWLNPAAFATPPIATAASATVASLGGKAMQARGPSYINLDASIFKDFHLNEQTKLQFRAEAFNLANHPQFNNPGNLDYTNASNFSEITSERGTRRLVQFALKLYY